jgi:hypothetical protein
VPAVGRTFYEPIGRISVRGSHCRAGAKPKQGGVDMEPVRISAAEVYGQIKAGKALLVCAYPDEAKCSTMKLEGAISRTEFESRLPGIKKDQPIVFYCA